MSVKWLASLFLVLKSYSVPSSAPSSGNLKVGIFEVFTTEKESCCCSTKPELGALTTAVFSTEGLVGSSPPDIYAGRYPVTWNWAQLPKGFSTANCLLLNYANRDIHAFFLYVPPFISQQKGISP